MDQTIIVSVQADSLFCRGSSNGLKNVNFNGQFNKNERTLKYTQCSNNLILFIHTQTIVVGKKDVCYDFLYLYGSVWDFLRCLSLSPKGTLFHSILQSQAPRAKPFSSPPPCGSMVYFCPSMESMRGTVHTVLTEQGCHAHTIHGGRHVMVMQDRTVGPAVTAWRLG